MEVMPEEDSAVTRRLPREEIVRRMAERTARSGGGATEVSHAEPSSLEYFGPGPAAGEKRQARRSERDLDVLGLLLDLPCQQTSAPFVLLASIEDPSHEPSDTLHVELGILTSVAFEHLHAAIGSLVDERPHDVAAGEPPRGIPFPIIQPIH